MQMQHESLKEQHYALEHELTHARTLKEASAESARFYKEQLDESTFRLQASEAHIVKLEQSLEALQRDATAEDSLLQSLQAVRSSGNCACATTLGIQRFMPTLPPTRLATSMRHSVKLPQTASCIHCAQPYEMYPLDTGM